MESGQAKEEKAMRLQCLRWHWTSVRKLGIQKVLICCDKDNIGSAKSIINNGGVLENEVEEDGQMKQRYWIQF